MTLRCRWRSSSGSTGSPRSAGWRCPTPTPAAGSTRGALPTAPPGDRPFVDEVSTLIGNLDLRPIVTTGYLREAFVGRDADLGLRVTIDHRVHGRDRDFYLPDGGENRFIIPPKLAIVEMKANERVPYWATDLTARLNMSVARISKVLPDGAGLRAGATGPIRLPVTA